MPAPARRVGAKSIVTIGAYGIEVSQLHWDMTSVSLHGAYEHPDEDACEVIQANAATLSCSGAVVVCIHSGTVN